MNEDYQSLMYILFIKIALSWFSMCKNRTSVTRAHIVTAVTGVTQTESILAGWFLHLSEVQPCE